MQNDLATFFPSSEPQARSANDMVRPEKTETITRGASRLLIDMGYALIPEMALPNGRRADLIGLNRKGCIFIVEVKSCREDFLCDHKWQAYQDFCDQFYFATDASFPPDLLPEEEGRIIADAFGGAILGNAPERPLAAARRKALTLKFARQAALRLTGTGL